MRVVVCYKASMYKCLGEAMRWVRCQCRGDVMRWVRYQCRGVVLR